MKTPLLLVALAAIVPVLTVNGAEKPASAPAAAEFSLAELDTPPKPIHTAPPRYPADLKRQRIQGEALIELVVDAQGEITQLRVLNSTQEEFGEAAKDAVSKWRFSPAVKDGKNVSCRLAVPIVFKL